MQPNTALLALLEAKEARAARQGELLAALKRPLVSFGVNWPGADKCPPQAKTVHDAGRSALLAALPAEALIYDESHRRASGFESLLAVDMAAGALKTLCCEIEERHPLGRLFDLDVIGEDGAPLSRSAIGQGPRPCILCGGNVTDCRRRAAHSMEALLAHLHELIERFEKG